MKRALLPTHFSVLPAKRRLASRAALFAAITAVTFTVTGFPTSAHAAVGRTEGAGAVSSTGEAQYTIPIFTPPGINGLTPDLAFVYGSNADVGMMGVGWTVAGLSVIARCPKTVAQNGIASGVDLATSDVFCLNGNQLRLVDGTYGANGSEYRTEIDDISRITAFGTVGNGPAWFKVEAKSGLIYEYGNTANSRIESLYQAIPTTAHTWALNEISDRSGNAITFTYQEDGAPNGDYRVTQIRYASNTGAGQSDYRVSFTYQNEPAPDANSGFVAGGKVKETKRLAQVDVTKGPSQLIRSYPITYEASLSSTGKSRVESIKECGGTLTNCLSPVTFTYQDGTNGFGSVTTYGGPTIPSGVEPLVLDFNGDGMYDLAWSSSATSGSGDWMIRVSNGNMFQSAVNTGIDNDGYEHAVVIDYNHDGKDDILVPCSGQTTWCVMEGTGPTGFSAPANTGAPLSSDPGDANAIDLNADGRDDLVWAENLGTANARIYWRARLPGTGFEPNDPGTGLPPLLYQGNSNPELYLASFFGNAINQSRHNRFDMNGDGFEDYALHFVQTVFVGPVPTITFTTEFRSAQGVGLGSGSGANIAHALALDMNGDGYSDLAYAGSGGVLAYQKSSGQNLLAAETGPAIGNYDMYEAVAIDWDSDGLEDILVPHNSNNELHYLRSTGEGFEAGDPTGIALANLQYLRSTDINGDGLSDLIFLTGTSDGTLKQVRHAGTGIKPDLLVSAADGHGNSIAFDHEPITKSGLYVRHTNASFPDQDYEGPVYVVERATISDGLGGTYNLDYAYEGLTRNVLGRSLMGFAERTITDSRNGVEVVEQYRRDFPFLGQLKQRDVKQSNGSLIEQVVNTWSTPTVPPEKYYFPYVSQTTRREYGVGNGYDGVMLTESVATISVNSSGTPHDTTITTTEKTGANGIFAGQSYTDRIHHTAFADNTANWCLGAATTTEITRNHTLTYGAAITRTVNRAWDTVNCRPTSIVTEPGDPDYQVTRALEYDTFGNVKKETVTGIGTPARVTQYGWGTAGQFLLSHTNPLSQVSTYSWDDDSGQLASATDPNGLVRSWLYDDFGRQTRETDVDATYTQYTLSECNAGNSYCSSADSRVRTKVRASSRQTTGTEIRYDDAFLDRLDRTVYTAVQTMDGGESHVRYEFDALGRPDRQSFPYLTGATQRYTTFAYDVVNRIDTVTRPTSQTNSTPVSTLFDYKGLTRETTSPESRVSAVVSDAMGRTVRSEDNGGHYQDFDLDAFGSLRRVRQLSGPTLYEASYDYGVEPFAVSVDDKDRGTRTYVYNALGELTSRTTAKSQTATYTYDKLSRPLTRVEPEGTATWTWGTSAAAHNIGRLQATSAPGVTESLQYDNKGRLSAHIRTITGIAFRHDYSYDATTGFLSSILYPSISGSRSEVDYAYDYGWTKSVRNAATGHWIWEGLSRDARGNVTERRGLITGSIKDTEKSEFDEVTNQLTKRRVFLADGGWSSLRLHWEFQYTAGGRLQQRTRFNSYGNQLNEEIYSYDNVGRLDLGTYEHRTDGASTHLDPEYGADGNISSMWRFGYSGVDTYSYGSSRPHAVTSAGSASYSYDANGNMTSRDGKTVTWHSYDKAKRIDGAGTDYSEFSWGANREVVQQVRQFNGAVRTTRYAGLTESNSAGWQHDVVVDGEVVARITDTGTTESWNVYHRDHIGSVIMRTSPSTIVDEAAYSAFGERRDKTTWTQSYTPPPGGWADATGYTGHEQLHHLNLVQMEGRIYDPGLGRFLSADPFVPDAENTQAFNRYSYVYNQPLDYTDPSGYFTTNPRNLRRTDDFRSGLTVSFYFSWFRTVRPWRDPNPEGCFAGTLACYGAQGQPRAPGFNPMHGIPRLLELNQYFDGELVNPSVVSGVLDFVPIVSQGKGVVQIVTGRDLITGERVSRLGEAAGLIPGVKQAKTAVKAAEGTRSVVRRAQRNGDAQKALPAPRGIHPAPTAENARLQGAINQLFREGDEIVGGTAGAVRHELATGTLVGGRSHIRKAKQRIRQLQKIIRQENLSPTDRATATQILDDLQDALSTTRVHP